MHFHSPDCGPSVEGFRAVFVAAIAYAVKNNISHVVLGVHAKGNLDGVVSDVIGEKAVKALMKGPINVLPEVRLGVMTERISIPFLGDVIIIAAHTSTPFLKELETNRQCRALFFAPWQPAELAEYLERHASTEIQTAP